MFLYNRQGGPNLFSTPTQLFLFTPQCHNFSCGYWKLYQFEFRSLLIAIKSKLVHVNFERFRFMALGPGRKRGRKKG
jgi:hypothetical protein